MHDKHKISIRKNYDLLLAPFITAAILLACFIIGKIYPFGSNNVEYYDMAQGIIPNFYHIWDVLHTKDTALCFNWYSGLGVNDTANASLSVFWIALLVLPRRLVGKAMGLYVIMTFSLSAFTSAIFLKKATKAKPFMTTLLSICYAFCGFSVMYYTNTWQDTVLLFPLYMLAWYALMKKGKILPYVLMTVLNVLCGYYVFILLVFYVFFMSFLYIKTIDNKENRKRRAFELGLSTVLGFGLSGVVLLPKLSQTLSSERFLSETGFDFSQIVKQYLEIVRTYVCKRKENVIMAKSTKSYEERMLEMEKKEQESLEKAKRYATQKKELLKRKKAEESKKRTHRLCQIGGAVESVLGAPIEEEDIPKLIGFLKRQEANGKFFSKAMQKEVNTDMEEV